MCGCDVPHAMLGTDNLQSHFKKYGEIIDAVIMKDRSTGHPRGFGFVTFADPAVCDAVVLDKHVIDGRTVSSGRFRERGVGAVRSLDYMIVPPRRWGD